MENNYQAGMQSDFAGRNVYIDTCSLMKFGAPVIGDKFFDRLRSALIVHKNSGRTLIVPYEVVAELTNIATTSTPMKCDMRPAAAKAWQRLVQLISEGLASCGEKLIGPDNGCTGDAAIQSIILLCSKMKNLVITNDRELQSELAQKSATVKTDCLIRWVTSDGWLKVPDGIQDNQRGGIDCFSRNGTVLLIDRKNVDIKAALSKTGDVLNGSGQNAYILGEKIARGGEATVYEVVGQKDVCAKIFDPPSLYKKTKCEMLASTNFDIKGAVIPTECLYNGDGVFTGILMPRITGKPLAMFYRPDWLEANAPEWDRRHFAMAAKAYIDTVCDLHNVGILLGDVKPANVLVGITDGKYDPGKLYIIDIDGAEMGTSVSGIIPPDGFTPNYSAPETLKGENNGKIYPIESEAFSVTLLAAECVLIGIHPFIAAPVSDPNEAVSITKNIKGRVFAYGAADERRTGIPPVKANLLWSNMTPGLKQEIYRMLTVQKPEDRPQLSVIRNQIDHYVSWITGNDYAESAPHARLLKPTKWKRFIKKCDGCDKTIDIANGEGEAVDKYYYCNDCLNAPAVLCSGCGKPIMTMREKRGGKIGMRMCHSCIKKLLAQSRIDSLSMPCSRCGKKHLFSKNEILADVTVCPDCSGADAAS